MSQLGIKPVSILFQLVPARQNPASRRRTYAKLARRGEKSARAGPDAHSGGSKARKPHITQSATPQQGARKRTKSAVAAPAMAAVLFLTGCIANGGTTAPTSSPAINVQDAPASNAPLETTQASTKIPVYWIGRSKDNVYLYREFRDISGDGNPVTTALRIMMAEKPLDHDFFTPWQEPGSLATSISGKNVITVDISRDAFNSNLDAGMAQRAVQQLVYTATAAASSSGLINSGQQIQVVILVDGHTDFMAFGQVKLGQPMARDASMVAPLWIIDPQEDTTLPAGAVKFNGRSTDSSKPVNWQILQDNGGARTSLLTGQVKSTGEPGQFGVFTFSATLKPGRYELRVTQVDSSGQADESTLDTRLFNVN
ncbi:GerMN domain-containing protein [Paenarthrobacter sp. NPDC090520]|uniref:GerMN domain-containing protein n=1 Tax=Paenarthrobacter sp. NPDC090520 TaxID=3364382 RepID=UPI0037FE3AB9